MCQLVHQAAIVDGDATEYDEFLEQAAHLEEVVGASVAYVDMVGEVLHWGDAPLIAASISTGLPEVGVPSRGAVGEGQSEVQGHRHQV